VLAAESKPRNPLVSVKTEKGLFVLELYPQEAPVAVGNCIKLVKEKFYEGLTFHRYEPGTLIQGGDPRGDGTGGPGYQIKDEKNKELTHERGAVGMAKTPAPNSAGSQFYICLRPLHFLDGRYTLFAKIIRGMDVVEKLRAGDRMEKLIVIEPKPAPAKTPPKKKP